jgi:hypothetical protein
VIGDTDVTLAAPRQQAPSPKFPTWTSQSTRCSPIQSLAYGVRTPSPPSRCRTAARSRSAGSVHEQDCGGPEAAGRINLKASALDNLVNIADAKRCYVEDLTVCILDRDRHRALIDDVRAAGARIALIPDGT